VHSTARSRGGQGSAVGGGPLAQAFALAEGPLPSTSNGTRQAHSILTGLCQGRGHGFSLQRERSKPHHSWGLSSFFWALSARGWFCLGSPSMGPVQIVWFNGICARADPPKPLLAGQSRRSGAAVVVVEPLLSAAGRLSQRRQWGLSAPSSLEELAPGFGALGQRWWLRIGRGECWKRAAPSSSGLWRGLGSMGNPAQLDLRSDRQVADGPQKPRIAWSEGDPRVWCVSRFYAAAKRLGTPLEARMGLSRSQLLPIACSRWWALTPLPFPTAGRIGWG